jgi:polyisoprenyl-phosphate glycosyltransferase
MGIMEEKINRNFHKIVTLIPVYNDWESVFILLQDLDATLLDMELSISVVLIDDGSTIIYDRSSFLDRLKCISELRIVELRRNLGSQRAIAVGLAYIEANINCNAVVVMDGDGEDRPSDVPRLIDKCLEENFTKVIFAYRRKRSESHQFKLFYWLYKKMFHLLTGTHIRVGNFSIIPQRSLKRLVAVAEIWNHFASGLIRSRLMYAEIFTDRGARIAGKSKMSFTSLVTHGLASLSVYTDVVGTRLLVLSIALLVIGLILIGCVLWIKLFTDLAIPGWATFTLGLLCLFILQTTTISLLLMFIVLGSRTAYTVLPCRDYKNYIIHSYYLKSGVLND